jgi:hypothetical protein
MNKAIAHQSSSMVVPLEAAVTPEVAGSSPVAPVFEVPALTVLVPGSPARAGDDGVIAVSVAAATEGEAVPTGDPHLLLWASSRAPTAGISPWAIAFSSWGRKDSSRSQR